MDFSNIYHDSSSDYDTNLEKKIENPPRLKSHNCFCMWSDLLGFGELFQISNWNLNHRQKRKIYNRLKAAHSAALYYSSFNERNLILNDGVAKVLQPQNRLMDPSRLSTISVYIRSCVQLHMSISKEEHLHDYPGCRSVLSFGENIEYLFDEIRLDDWVFNWSKKGKNVSNWAGEQGNPIVIYNPKELQMNTAFSKAFLLESGGKMIGLPGNHFYIDKSTIEGVAKYAKKESYELSWKETSDELFMFVVKEKKDINSKIMGFCFDTPPIEPQMEKYKTTVYRLKKFYPHDENPDEFFFDLDVDSDRVP